MAWKRASKLFGGDCFAAGTAQGRARLRKLPGRCELWWLVIGQGGGRTRVHGSLPGGAETGGQGWRCELKLHGGQAAWNLQQAALESTGGPH